MNLEPACLFLVQVCAGTFKLFKKNQIEFYTYRSESCLTRVV